MDLVEMVQKMVDEAVVREEQRTLHEHRPQRQRAPRRTAAASSTEKKK